MNYREALDYINSTSKFGSKLGLERINFLLELLNNPHRDLKIIHVAGTNGKGSTSSFIATMLIEVGYNVGLYTSPSLESFNDRIRLNGKWISNDELARITEKVKEKVDQMVKLGKEHPTEFEIVTAIALQYYKEKKADFVVLEVGLGGRYDSTNVIERPLISVITPISMDHMDKLGDTLGKIAWEKAGIIKNKVPVICYPQEKEAQEVIDKVANNNDSTLIKVPIDNIQIDSLGDSGSVFGFKYDKYYLSKLEIKLLGKHQVFNCATALTTILFLKNIGEIIIEEKDIRNGLKNTIWNGRLEILRKNPYFIIDGAHNLQGVKVLKESITKLFNYRRLILGISILADKSVEDMVKELATLADTVIVTEADNPRVLKAEELSRIIKKYNQNCRVIKDIKKSLEEAYKLSEANDLILFCGSLYLIKDVRKTMLDK